MLDKGMHKIRPALFSPEQFLDPGLGFLEVICPV